MKSGFCDHTLPFPLFNPTQFLVLTTSCVHFHLSFFVDGFVTSKFRAVAIRLNVAMATGTERVILRTGMH